MSPSVDVAPGPRVPAMLVWKFAPAIHYHLEIEAGYPLVLADGSQATSKQQKVLHVELQTVPRLIQDIELCMLIGLSHDVWSHLRQIRCDIPRLQRLERTQEVFFGRNASSHLPNCQCLSVRHIARRGFVHGLYIHGQ